MPDAVSLVRHGEREDSVDAPLRGITRLVREEGRWTLAFTGDTSHLED